MEIIKFSFLVVFITICVGIVMYYPGRKEEYKQKLNEIGKKIKNKLKGKESEKA